MYVCMYVCMYIGMYVQVENQKQGKACLPRLRSYNVCMYVCMYVVKISKHNFEVYIHTRLHICMYNIRTNTSENSVCHNTFIYVYIHINNHVHTHIHTFTYTCTHMHSHAHTHTHTCTYTCTHIHTSRRSLFQRSGKSTSERSRADPCGVSRCLE